jgi:tetrahedral aminopeptidase
MVTNGDFGEFELLRKLTEAPGVSGREERVRELILAETAGMWDETRTDAMGSLICLKKADPKLAAAAAKKRAGGAKAKGDGAPQEAKTAAVALTPPTPDGRPLRVMLACHMDEIGFYVRFIDADGRLRVQNAGGFDTRNLFARKVLVQGREDLVGVLNPTGKPVHLASEEDKKKIPEIKDFFVDLFLPKRQVEKLVQIGDPVTLLQRTEMTGDAILGKSMDNRVALWVAINAIRKLGGRSPYDVYFVACVQEEVGVRGATTSAYAIDPDIGIAIDVTLCCDTPGIEKDDAVTVFGEGVGIKVMDSLSISHRGLLDDFVRVAKAKKIKYQLEVLPRGGTDAGAVQRPRAGLPAITLSVPTRYIHTVTEAIHRKDAKAAVDLLAAWLGG